MEELARLWSEYQAQRIQTFVNAVANYPKKREKIQLEFKSTLDELVGKNIPFDEYKLPDLPQPTLQKPTFENFMDWLAFSKYKIKPSKEKKS